MENHIPVPERIERQHPAGGARDTGQERPYRSRIASAGILLASGTVLGIAAWLQPDARGFATHTQLGLSECAVLRHTGFPCPMCGMTTTFALMADLRPVDALANQPFGVVLFALTAAAAAISAVGVVTPRGRWVRIGRAVGPFGDRLMVGFLAAMTAGWLYKIALVRGWW